MSENVTEFERFRRRAYFLVFVVLSTLFVLRFPNIVLMFFAAVLVAVDLRGMTNWVSGGLGRISFLQRREGVRYALSMVIAVLVVLGVLAGLGFMVGVPFVAQLDELRASVSAGWENLRQQVETSTLGRRLLHNAPAADLIIRDWSGKVYGAFSGALGVLTGVLAILVIGVYLAISAERYVAGILSLTVAKKKARVALILDTTAHALRYWTLGRLTSMAATGILTALGLWIIGVSLPMSLGVLVGVCSFVPIVGTLLGALPGVLLALTVSLEMAVSASVVYIVVQLLEGNLITPLVQRRTISLPPVILLVSQTLAAAFAGLLGIIFATPAAVAVMVIVQIAYVHDVLGNEVTPLGQQKPLSGSAPVRKSP